MNTLIEKNLIKEMECGSNFSYILSEDSIFLSTEYKVLQSQAKSCFVKCMKMMYNGKIQLYYLTGGLKSLESMLPTLDADSFLTIVSNLFADIIDVKHNGFLSCQNIDISFNRIYVDTATNKVSLVYLPLAKHVHDDSSSFENDIRTGLIKLISGLPALSTAKTMQFSADLSNGTLTIEDLHSRIKSGITLRPEFFDLDKSKENKKEKEKPAPEEPKTENSDIGKAYVDTDNDIKLENGSFSGISTDNSESNFGRAVVNNSGAMPGTLRITALNAPIRIQFVVNKDGFVIGKKVGFCDGVVGFNKMISRSHCRINIIGSQYAITDLQSANGTFVNGTKLQPNRAFPIKNGDIIRLANSGFQISIE